MTGMARNEIYIEDTVSYATEIGQRILVFVLS